MTRAARRKRAIHRPRPLRRRRWPWIIAVLALAALIIADRSGWLLTPAGDDFERYHEAMVRVTHIVDGDTLDIAMPDPNQKRDFTRVRLWGIDCPELSDGGHEHSALARAARQFAVNEALDRTVVLRLEAHQPRDSFGRILAHVDLERGTSLNRLLLLEGLAQADARWTHSRLLVYEQAELTARRARRGIWAPSR